MEKINSLDTNENNFIIKSKIEFNYREDGNYGEEILRFMNYVINIPKMKIEQD